MKNICLSLVLLSIFISCASSKKIIKTPLKAEVPKIQETNQVKEISKKVVEKVQSFKKTTPSAKTFCKSGTDTRVLTIIPIESTGCELQYTKNGEAKTVANANFNPSYCTTVKDRIMTKLKAAGFNCQ